MTTENDDNNNENGSVGAHPSNNNNDADYRAQMYQLVVPAFLLLSLLAILANCLVILALRAARVRNATVTLLMSLTFSDIWSSSIMALSLLLNSYLPTVLHTRPRPCLALCLEMFRTGGLLTAALHLLLIALHHCVGIVRPHQDKLALRRFAFACCFFAWVLPPACLFLLALGRPAQGLWNCERVDFYYERPFRWAISGLLFALFLAISLCYARLLFLLHIQNGNLCKKLDGAGGGSGAERKRRRERRTLGTTLLICISFLLGWAPASILFALTCSDCRFLTGGSFRLLFGLSCVQLSFLLAKSLLNPLIYSLRIPEVRQQFCRHLPLIRGISNGGGMTGSGQSSRLWGKSRSHLFASSFSSIGRGGGGGHQQEQKEEEGGHGQRLLVPDRPPEGGGGGQQRLTVPRRSECIGWKAPEPSCWDSQRHFEKSGSGQICRTASARN